MSSIKIVIRIILVILITIICCIFLIKPKVFNFKLTKEYEYIMNNKKDIDKIIIRNNSQLGMSCYKLDIEKGYDILNNINIKKETELWCSHSDVYLEFYFNNGIYKEIHFDCGNLVYDDINYELINEFILVNKDDFILDKITNGMVIVSNNEKIDC